MSYTYVYAEICKQIHKYSCIEPLHVYVYIYIYAIYASMYNCQPAAYKLSVGFGRDHCSLRVSTEASALMRLVTVCQDLIRILSRSDVEICHTYLHTYVRTHIYTYIMHMHIHIQIYTHTYTSAYTRTHTDSYIDIHVHMHIHIYIYIYTCI